MTRRAVDGPIHPRSARRNQRGSVVTYGVVALMVVSLFIYLLVAYFAEDAGDAGSPGAPGSVAEEVR
jgi:hypothetical protein